MSSEDSEDKLALLERDSVASALDHLEEVVVNIHSLADGPLPSALVERADDLAGRLKEVLGSLHKAAEQNLPHPAALPTKGKPHVD